MPPILGCIADDFTGATDLAGILVLNGMRASVVLGVQEIADVADVDTVVVALKSRTAPVTIAVQQSVEALRWLKKLGCQQFYLKYCSTFDSRPSGNIGPVIDALMEELETDFTIVCPAFPATGRTVYKSNLFVHDVPLSESSMRDHPLTPMQDSNLIRLLAPQTTRRVGGVTYQIVCSGAPAIEEAIGFARTSGTSIAVVDAIFDEDLKAIAHASSRLTLRTGASGLAVGIPDQLRRQSLLPLSDEPDTLPHIEGFSAILSGSCSATTHRQVAEAQRRMPSFQFDPFMAAADHDLSDRIVDWARTRLPREVILISATTNASSVARAQEELGADRASGIVEKVLAETAVKLAAIGLRRLIVAGGETSGAIVGALDILDLRIGPQIDPGVHWAVGKGKYRMALALKSGNFGADDCFLKAWSVMP